MNAATELEAFGKKFLDTLEQPSTEAQIIDYLSGHDVPRVGHSFETTTKLCFEALERAGANSEQYAEIANILARHWQNSNDKNKHLVDFLLERFVEFPDFQLPIYEVLHNTEFKKICQYNKDTLFFLYHQARYHHNIETVIEQSETKDQLLDTFKQYQPKEHLLWCKKNAQEKADVEFKTIKSLITGEHQSTIQILHLEAQTAHKNDSEKFAELVNTLYSDKNSDYQGEAKTAQIIHAYNQASNQRQYLEAADIEPSSKLHQILAPTKNNIATATCAHTINGNDLNKPIILFLNEESALEKSVIQKLSCQSNIQQAQAHIHENNHGHFVHGFTQITTSQELSTKDYDLLRRNNAYLLTQNQYEAWINGTPTSRTKNIWDLLKKQSTKPHRLINKIRDQKNLVIEINYDRGSVESPSIHQFYREHLQPYGYSYNILHAFALPSNLHDPNSKKVGALHTQFVDEESNEVLPEKLSRQFIDLFQNKFQNNIKINWYNELHKDEDETYLWSKLIKDIIIQFYPKKFLRELHHYYLLEQGTRDILNLATSIEKIDSTSSIFRHLSGFTSTLDYLSQRNESIVSILHNLLDRTSAQTPAST